MNNTTVIIKTINRPTLEETISNTLDSGFEKVVVVSDGAKLNNTLKDKYSQVSFLELKRKFGHYGAYGINVAIGFIDTPYFTIQDDDDLFTPNASKIINKFIDLDPSVDIWIPGAKYCGAHNDMAVCMNGKLGVIYGNVTHPTYKTEILTKIPFTNEDPRSGVDFRHVEKCHKAGYKVDWFGKLLILLRPNSPGSNGSGKFDDDSPSWVLDKSRGEQT